MKATKLSLFSAVALTVSAEILERRPTCNADNCARAVQGTFRAQQSSRLQDCSSFQRITVTPATRFVLEAPTNLETAWLILPSFSTVTVTASTSTVYVTTTAGPLQRKRFAAGEVNDLAVRQVTVVPSAVPTYASACSGSARYSSACSCAGVTRTTITASTPLTTTTSSPTTTSTILYQPCADTNSYSCSTDACYCFPAARGGGICLDPDGTCTNACKSDADCVYNGQGSFCVTGNNCNDGSTCSDPPEAAGCVNGASVKRLFRRRLPGEKTLLSLDKRSQVPGS